ncbi:2-amino-4-hydroxy-6-hydroxymethyldihydropteridine diphosphokinase [Alteromonas antoniana]|uniref:2-amino-4-hydroxy-6- hydroxymethyldihydropteridine diphosphokinase n=1 Tax=Alteromonas antoniana TaxID=2803813 RepID=UPI001C48D8E8|nr:2-amino-4-hydroxy-6-hydroxymethyldihydropteridine diphosphokinase [Alteromonas antoniana]
MDHHVILISVGTNIDRAYHTRQSRIALETHFSNVSVSRVYESEAVGFNGKPFYNLVVRAVTSLPVDEVCHQLKQIEKDNGRVHTDKKFCSRTLDLDLLTYDDLVTATPVELPRGEILYNAFVLQPLAELVPDAIHPVEKKSYATLWREFDASSQSLWPIAFEWSS